MTVPIVLNITDVFVELEPVVTPKEPVVDQPAEPNIEISWKEHRPAISDDYAHLHKSNFNIDQSNDLNSFDEAMSCQCILASSNARGNLCMIMLCGIL